MSKILKESNPGRKAGAFPYPLTLAKRDGYLHVPSNSRLSCVGTEESTMPTRRAVFLDRDGVIVEDVHFLTSRNQLKFLPGVASALRGLQEHFFIIVVTNQSGIARGYLTEEELTAVHTELICMLAAEGVAVDALYYCPHLPGATIPAYGMDCSCRKPQPGMLLRAADDWGIDLTQSFLVGDMPRDIQAANAAGVKAIQLKEAGAGHWGKPDFARDLLEATDLVLAAAEGFDLPDTKKHQAPDWRTTPARQYNGG